MTLTDAQILLLRESHEWLRPEMTHVSGQFYNDLFNRHPKVRALFGAHVSRQAMQFTAAIDAIISGLDDPDTLSDKISELADLHADMHIPAAYHAYMRDALVDTFSRVLGPRFTHQMQMAWRSVLEQISAAMMSRTDAAQ